MLARSHNLGLAHTATQAGGWWLEGVWKNRVRPFSHQTAGSRAFGTWGNVTEAMCSEFAPRGHHRRIDGALLAVTPRHRIESGAASSPGHGNGSDRAGSLFPLATGSGRCDPHGWRMALFLYWVVGPPLPLACAQASAKARMTIDLMAFRSGHPSESWVAGP